MLYFHVKYAAHIIAANRKCISFMSFENITFIYRDFKLELDHYLTNVARVKST